MRKGIFLTVLLLAVLFTSFAAPMGADAAVTITEYAIPTGGSQPIGITAGPDGNLWFTELSGNKIGKITTSGTITEFPAGGSQPYGITAGRVADKPTVSFPYDWKELEKLAKQGDPEKLQVTHSEAVSRTGKKGDLFLEVLTKKQKLPRL
jgi:hypothetical protein